MCHSFIPLKFSRALIGWVTSTLYKLCSVHWSALSDHETTVQSSVQYIYGLNQHYAAFFSFKCLEISVKECALRRSILTYCQNR